MPVLAASLVRASKGWSPEAIDSMTMADFWMWVDAFRRLAQLEQDEMDRQMARVPHGNGSGSRF